MDVQNYTAWIKDNKGFMIGLLLLLSTAGTISVLQGCSPDRWVKINVSPEARQRMPYLPPKVSLADGYSLREQIVGEAQRDVSAWNRILEDLDSEIQQGERTVGWLMNLLNVGLNTARDAAGTTPVGGILLTLLAGMTGLMAPRPSEAKRRNDSFNKGLSEGERIARNGT